MSNYVSLIELKNSNELVGMSFADHDLIEAIASAEAGIEEYCGRTFYLGSSSTATRYYTPTELGYVAVNDIVTAATVATDGDGDGVFEQSWVADSDYMLWPWNAAADGRPFERIMPNPSSSLRFTCRPRSVKVIGQFGWLEVPAPVRQATSIMATRLMRRRREAPFGVIGLGIDGAPVLITKVDPDLGFLLDPFIRGQGVLAA